MTVISVTLKAVDSLNFCKNLSRQIKISITKLQRAIDKLSSGGLSLVIGLTLTRLITIA